MAVLAPIPSARVATAIRLNPGLRLIRRKAKRRSPSTVFIVASPAGGFLLLPYTADGPPGSRDVFLLGSRRNCSCGSTSDLSCAEPKFRRTGLRSALPQTVLQ